ncbi:protein Rhs, partial [Salmonella enterica subsp. enterica serovar Wangata]|nr:protein Rhs [Salmonella enterica subsp. enterica serovar Wangata]
MADNVAARQATGWIVVCTTPDVCKTPMGSSTPPVPYRVTAQMSDAVQVVPTVNANGRPLVVLTQSFIPKTDGDEQGVAKGVQSGTVADICEPLEHSSSVKAAGYYVLRHDDRFYMNCKNTVGKIVGQTPSVSKSTSDSNPEVVPETPEEKGFWKTLVDSLNQETDSRVAAIRNLNDVLGDSPPAIPPPKGLANFSVLAAVTNPQIPSDVFRKIAANGGPEEQAVFDHAYDKYGGALTALFSVGLMYVSGGGAAGLKSMASAEAGLKGPALAEGRGMINMETRLTDEGASLINHSKVGPEGGVIVTGEGAELTAAKTVPPNTITEPGMQVRQNPSVKPGNEGTGQTAGNVSSAGEPVDMVTGDFLQHLSVLTVPGTLPLTLTRLYRSRTDASGLFGAKWTDEWSRFLELDAGKIHFTDHEGVTLTYTIPDNGLLVDAVNSRVSSYVLSGDIRGELSVFDRRSQQYLIFGEKQGPLRRLSAIRDGYGNTATFVYRDERLVQVTHSDGYVLDLDWLNGQLASITLAMQEKTQRLVTCRYDEQGMLAECDSFQFAHRWHRYDPEGRMVFWRDEDGTQVDLCYDAQGRVTETKTPEGYYNDRFIYNDAERQNSYVDAEGGRTDYWYNEDGLTVRRTDPLGRETLTEWENSRRKTVTDALGRITAWEYNRYGDITRLSLPGGVVLHYRYDDSGNLIRFQGPGNKIWQFDYDEHGGLLTITDPQGRQSSRLYGDHGELLQQVLPDGETWHYGHDPLHRLNRI